MIRWRILLPLVVGLASLAGGWFVRPMVFGSTSSPAQANAGLEACHALIVSFTAYPLVYIGDNFDGLPLNQCERRQTSGTPYGIPPTDQVIFIYGTCTPTGPPEDDAPSCLPPLQVSLPRVCPDSSGCRVFKPGSGPWRRGI